MNKIRTALAASLLMLVSASAFANSTEELRYSWRLKGGVRFLAGFMFPTNGVGNLRTTAPGSQHMVHSELLITAPTGKSGGFYLYESDIDERTGKTLTTSSGYAWGKKSRSESTVLDYVKGLARIRKQTPEGVENRVKKLPGEGDQMRDVLTAIYFIRQNAHTITGPMQTNVYTDGKEYPVIIRPGAKKNFVVSGKQTPATVYEIIDAPGGKKWQGGVKVWLTADDRRLPVRIEIQQSVASLQLDLQEIVGPPVMVAQR
jgi:Protein of unknown function (DUF3108)